MQATAIFATSTERYGETQLQVYGWMALIMGLGMILGAAYSLTLYRRVIFGKAEKPEIALLKDLTWVEKCTLIPLAVSTIIFGIYPQPILHLSEATIEKWVTKLEPKMIKVRNF